MQRMKQSVCAKTDLHPLIPSIQKLFSFSVDLLADPEYSQRKVIFDSPGGNEFAELIISPNQTVKTPSTVPNSTVPAPTLAVHARNLPIQIGSSFSIRVAAEQIRVYLLANLQGQGEEAHLLLSLSG